MCLETETRDLQHWISGGKNNQDFVQSLVAFWISNICYCFTYIDFPFQSYIFHVFQFSIVIWLIFHVKSKWMWIIFTSDSNQEEESEEEEEESMPSARKKQKMGMFAFYQKFLVRDWSHLLLHNFLLVFCLYSMLTFIFHVKVFISVV